MKPILDLELLDKKEDAPLWSVFLRFAPGTGFFVKPL
jgi:hypothetical protein